ALASFCMAHGSEIVAAGSGFLPENWLLQAGSARGLTRPVRRRRSQPWLPCPPQALPELREQIAARLVQHGIAAGAANIATTYGASQAFDLLARILFPPGDPVLVEDPGYFVLFEQLRAHHVRLIPVPRRADGPDLEALEAACRAHRPRARLRRPPAALLLHADAAPQPDRLERRPGALPPYPVARRAVRLCGG